MAANVLVNTPPQAQRDMLGVTANMRSVKPRNMKPPSARRQGGYLEPSLFAN